MSFEQSKWIWSPETDEINVYRSFNDIFTAVKSESYTIRLSCDTNYALYLNGAFVNCGQYSDYENLKYYDEIDLTSFVREGENKLVIDVYYQGVSSSTYRYGKAGLIFELICGGEVILVSSENTLTGKLCSYAVGNLVEHVSGQLGFSFRYDARLKKLDNYNESAVEVSKTRQLLPRPIKKLEVALPAPALLTVRGGFTDMSGETIGQRMQYSALAFTEPNISTPLPDENGITIYAPGKHCDGVFALIDLGAESAGLLAIDIDLPRESEVLIGWGEHLEDLRVRAYVGGRNFCASYYGYVGRNTFFNPFRRCGARYIELHVYAPSFKLYYAGIRSTDYPIERQASFYCADSTHRHIYDVSLRTLLLCMHEHYEDCPWREQALYTMDSRNQMLCGYYTFHEYDFARASLRLMAHSIREDNMLELCSPAEVGITIPSFSAIFLTQLWEYLDHSGDAAFVREMLPCAECIANEFIRRTNNSKHLITCFTETKYWNFYEWQAGLEGSITGSVKPEDVTYDAPLNAFVSFGLRSLADILGKLGDHNSERHYRREQIALNCAINDEFYDVTRGAYATYSKNGEKYHYAELTNALIAYAGIADKTKLDSVLEKLTNGSLIPVTLSHSIFKYEALLQKPEQYAHYVFGDIAKKWGSMLNRGATSFWETSNGAADFGNAGSLCHGWSAIPAYFYLKYAVKLPPETTGLYECKVED